MSADASSRERRAMPTLAGLTTVMGEFRLAKIYYFDVARGGVFKTMSGG